MASEVCSSLTVLDVFNKFYLKHAPTLDFYPTLSSKSVYWALLWAKTIFAGVVWPQAGDYDRSLFSDVTVSRNSSSLIRSRGGLSDGAARST